MSNIKTALNLTPCCQIGFVYPNLEEAITMYEPLFGEFKIIELGLTHGAVFRGKESPYSIRMGVGYSGDLEIELIEWVEGDTPHSEFIKAGKSGMHHMSFTVDDLDFVVEQAKTLGYEAIWYHAMSDDLKYVYLERKDDPLLVELTQRPWSGGNIQLDN
tara:strand:+ start:461 stop:937 length:477 start_codon:yes stop_codon:yes gene_type:complete